MPKAVPPLEIQLDGLASFGAGLGADFEPHTKSIIVGPRHDHKGLKVKVREPEQIGKHEDD
ncbi:hypothetical protein GFL60_01045 [Rhizobium leguminosarum bv. viciae]|nr:hypothetical protein [Rhizobium leguminosarum bv. viciae]